MVNGNYISYEDRPPSDSEVVHDHVHAHKVGRKHKRKCLRSSNNSQPTNLSQLDNDTDSIKYEKKIKTPRPLRYVPTTEVQEHYVTDKFETYDLKPTEEPPKRYAFVKKPRNPTDGSQNYAYSRSSSSSSSPTGNLPPIAEDGEHYRPYRGRSPTGSPIMSDVVPGYETKLEKYFTRPQDVRKFVAKGSHPDSLYRVVADSSLGGGKMTRFIRLLRWPFALLTVCVALAVFVYFLMPDSMLSDNDNLNTTIWEGNLAASHKHTSRGKLQHGQDLVPTEKGFKTPEIDFYENESVKKDDVAAELDKIVENMTNKKLPIPPVFPSHITPEVQYGNEKADTEKTRNAKNLDETNTLSDDSTLKPQITQKPEKPLAIYFKNGQESTTSTSTETFTSAESINEFSTADNNGLKEIEKETTLKATPVYKETSAANRQPVKEDTIPPELEELLRQSIKIGGTFTSGHSKLFGVSIEDVGNPKSTTQSSTYNTRVSPTLPTWRDDHTTKKYPINFDVPQCRSTHLQLCRGVLPYDLATSPATVGGVDLSALLPQFEYLVATNCSNRLRQFACALLEPECSPKPYPTLLPCHNLCRAIIDSCEDFIPLELKPIFNCDQYTKGSCVAARAPCSTREYACSDRSCIPREWLCDGNKDCPAGEDETLTCSSCERNEFRCRSGTCIMSQWVCDGYSDCPDGDDEQKNVCETRGKQLGSSRSILDDEEPSGSAPAPSIRRPNRLPPGERHIGESDSSKELLITSDSNNALKRNFTRRPLPSRLTPYRRRTKTPTVLQPVTDSHDNRHKPGYNRHFNTEKPKPSIDKKHGLEPVDDAVESDIFGDLENEQSDNTRGNKKSQYSRLSKDSGISGIDKKNQKDSDAKSEKVLSMSKPEMGIVLDGASMLRKAAEAEAAEVRDQMQRINQSEIQDFDEFSQEIGRTSHISPCPSGELRCVDGRCITLSQLCDGTIDCSDHADEDNCFT